MRIFVVDIEPFQLAAPWNAEWRPSTSMLGDRQLFGFGAGIRCSIRLILSVNYYTFDLFVVVVIIIFVFLIVFLDAFNLFPTNFV